MLISGRYKMQTGKCRLENADWKMQTDKMKTGK
jgi:hypothetical protein